MSLATDYIKWLYRGRPVQSHVACIHGVTLDNDCEQCMADRRPAGDGGDAAGLERSERTAFNADDEDGF